MLEVKCETSKDICHIGFKQVTYYYSNDDFSKSIVKGRIVFMYKEIKVHPFIAINGVNITP